MNQPKLEPIIYLLCGLIVFFSFVLLGCSVFLKQDGQTFQVFGGILGSLVGALLIRIKSAPEHMPTSTTATATGDPGSKVEVTTTSTDFPVPAPAVFSSKIPPPGETERRG